MAKAATKTNKSFTFAVGDKVVFNKYSQPLDPGQKPLFKKGDTGEIVSQDEISKDPKDPYETYTVRNSKGKDESLFYPDEISAPKGKASAKEEVTEKAPAKAAKKGAKPTASKAVAKAKTVEPAEGEDGEEQLILTDAVSTLIEDKSAVEAARDLLQGVSTSYFTLGGVLAHIKVTGAYKDVAVLGGKKGQTYDDFIEFCQKELGQEKAKVYQLIGIYRKLSEAGVDESKFVGVGWTFAREMAKVITSENADDLIDQAQEMQRDEFVNYVRKTYIKDGAKATAADKISRVRYSFTVHGDQADSMGKALKVLGKKLGTDDNGTLFHHLCVAFLQEEGQTTLEQDIKFVSDTHGVELTVAPKAKAAKSPAKAPAKAAPAKKATAKAPAKKAAKAKARA